MEQVAETLGSGWEQRRRQVALEIENVAIQLFAARGFDEITFVDIGRAVGVSSRTIFRYFSTKEEVLLALPRRVIGQIREALLNQPRDLPLLDAVHQAISEVGQDLDKKTLLRWGTVATPLTGRLGGVAPVASAAYVDFLVDRLGKTAKDIQVQAIAATLASLQQVAFGHWLQSAGRADLGDLSHRVISSLTTVFGQPEEAALRSKRRASRRRLA